MRHRIVKLKTLTRCTSAPARGYTATQWETATEMNVFKKSSIAITTAFVVLTTVPVWSQNEPAQPSDLPELKADAPDSYVVKFGDTLWASLPST